VEILDILLFDINVACYIYDESRNGAETVGEQFVDGAWQLRRSEMVGSLVDVNSLSPHA
jgi:hypothetical protein